MEGGELDRHAGHFDGREHRKGAHVAELADVPHHPLELCHSGRRRELPGDRPARVPADGAESALQLEVVDLHDRSVDLEVELSTASLPCHALCDHLLLPVEQGDAVVYAEAVLAEPLQALGVGLEAEPLGNPDLVAPDRQRPLRRVGRVELADRAGGGVAGIHEGRFARFGAALVERREVAKGHVDLAPHLDQRGCVLDPQRDRADRAQVVGDVLADLPIAARSPPLERAVPVEQADRETVDLRLDDVGEAGLLDALAGEVVAHPLDPRPQLVPRAHVAERQHRLQMADFLEARDRLTADSLRRRVGRQQLGVLTLDPA